MRAQPQYANVAPGENMTDKEILGVVAANLSAGIPAFRLDGYLLTEEAINSHLWSQDQARDFCVMVATGNIELIHKFIQTMQSSILDTAKKESI